MSLTEILPSARQLSAADKFRLIRLLATEIDDAAAVAPIEHGKTYHLQTPRFEEGAATELLKELETSAAR